MAKFEIAGAYALFYALLSEGWHLEVCTVHMWPTTNGIISTTPFTE